MAVSPFDRRRLGMMVAKDPMMLARLAAQSKVSPAMGMKNLQEVAGLEAPEPPKIVTPAAPAPVAQGQQIEAPARTAPPQVKAASPEAILGQARMQAAALQDAAAQAAVVPEEVEKVIASREKRYEGEMQDLENDQKRAGWEALAMAGMKMAQSQSPYFMSALAAGMEAGLTGFNAKKAAAAERKARLQEQQENAVLDRFRAKREEESRAEAKQAREIGVAGQLLGQQDLATKAYIGQETYQPAIEAARLAPQKERAGIAQTEAQTGLYGAQAGYYNRSPGAGMGGDGGGTPSPFGRGVSTVIGALIRSMDADNKIIADPLASKAAKAQAEERLRQKQAQYQQLMGGGSAAGSSLLQSGYSGPQYRYDPNSGRIVPAQ